MKQHIELFAGAGGMALGCAQAGFAPFIYQDNDKYCYETLRMNNKAFGNGGPVIHCRDIRETAFNDLQTEITLLSGGVPCQPWSVGGLAKGIEDNRNLWPEFTRVLGECLPKAFIIENVQGILRPQFRQYFDYLLKALRSPTVRRWGDEPWESHLNAVRHAGGAPKLHYDVHILQLNAVNYCVPQERKRLFLVGFRKDLGIDFKFPYRHWWNDGNDGHAHTLRDAIADLPDPRFPDGQFGDHIFVPGASVYRGHTPNLLDEPAKTVKAGVHGMPGGEGVVELDDGSIRYLTVRELARIQTFPDGYQFAGSRTQQIKQIGNAVPPRLAYHVAKSVYDSLVR
jgi:DNA (cytosine-5)-methyltransferase 1